MGCEWNLKLDVAGKSSSAIRVERYDRIESLYLTTGDFSALKHMNIDYPIQTRTLIEDVLKIGRVNDPQINSKFLNFLSGHCITEPDKGCGVSVCKYGRCRP